MGSKADEDHLIEFRRDLHEHPELSWCELYTTSRILDEIRDIGVDELYIGPEMLTTDRLRPPEKEALQHGRRLAQEAGVEEELLEDIGDGYTGALAVLRNGEGPVVGLRVDIDGLPISESEDKNHLPVSEGFRSQYEEQMHACGHDAHATIGIGVLQQIKESDFQGTFKIFFQPAEEIGAGAASIVDSGHLEDIDSLFAVHVGLDQEFGAIIPGIDSYLAINGFNAEILGESAHAGNNPNAGSNALHAMATAIETLYAIPRHADGTTRVNVGQAEGGTAMNIIPEESHIQGEVRGETTELRMYMEDRVERILEHAAALHGCDVNIEFMDGAPSATCDEELVETVSNAAREQEATLIDGSEDALGGSEDATRLMKRVQENGGKATYVGIGGGNRSGHHTSQFDIDEQCIFLAVDVLSDAILSTSKNMQEYGHPQNRAD